MRNPFLLMICLMSLTAWGPMVKADVGEAATLSSSLKSFREWRNDKVSDAERQSQSTLEKIKHVRSKAPSVENNKLIQQLEQQYAQETWNADVARELTIKDYAVLYLSQQTSPQQLSEVAGKLSADEVAEILSAYVRTVGGIPTVSKPLLPSSALMNK